MDIFDKKHKLMFFALAQVSAVEGFISNQSPRDHVPKRKAPDVIGNFMDKVDTMQYWELENLDAKQFARDYVLDAYIEIRELGNLPVFL